VYKDTIRWVLLAACNPGKQRSEHSYLSILKTFILDSIIFDSCLIDVVWEGSSLQEALHLIANLTKPLSRCSI
jgi:hypothetical protein